MRLGIYSFVFASPRRQSLIGVRLGGAVASRHASSVDYAGPRRQSLIGVGLVGAVASRHTFLCLCRSLQTIVDWLGLGGAVASRHASW